MLLTQLLQEAGIDYREHGDHAHASEGWIQTDCPLCSPNSGHFRLGFNLTNLAASCWVCGKSNAGEMLAALTGKTRKAAWFALGKVDRLGVRRKARGKLKLPSRCGPLLPAHKSYLDSRGFDPYELVRLWGLMGTGYDSSLPWRIVIPVTLDREIVSFSCRDLHDKGQRYRNARPEEEAVSAKDCLFGEEYVTNAVIVVEGFFDAMRVGPGAVATMGLSVTDSQVRRIARYMRRVVVFDNSPDAQSRASRLADELSLYPGETYVVEIDSKDPGCCAEEERDYLRGFLQ